MNQNYQKEREKTFLILGAFLVCWLVFFVIPGLSGQQFQYYRFLLDMPTIGADLKQAVHYSESLPNPYVDRNVYPPMASVVFSVRPEYWVMVVLSVASMVSLWFLTDRSVVSSLIFAGAIVEYGFLFELERGQWNVISFALSMWGVRLWGRNKLVGGSLLTLAIQLKLWPVIFVPMLWTRKQF